MLKPGAGRRLNKFRRASNYFNTGRRPQPQPRQSFYQLPEAPPPLLEPPDELRLLELELELLLDELPPPLLVLTLPGKKPNSRARPAATPVGSQDSQSRKSKSG
jgi:hypothetical protein